MNFEIPSTLGRIETTQSDRVIPTEVYSRVVGYYRPVQNWNHGKKQEFRERNTYDRKLKEACNEKP